MRVEVVYGDAKQQDLISLDVEEGITAQEAIEKSGILDEYPEIDLTKNNKVGIFGKIAPLTKPLRDKDRVEIYRPLIADPKEIRKQRAAAGKKLKKGGK